MNNLTPKEKAKELVEKIAIYHWTDVCDYEGAKQCALIAVDEKIAYAKTFGDTTESDIKEFEQVKQEIIKL